MPDDSLLQRIHALRGDITNADVRAQLGALPCWDQPQGPGRTGYLDVAPIRTAPRVRGMTPDPGKAGRKEGFRPILASPLGIVAVLGGPLITVLDPDTGKVHATTPVVGSNTPPITLHGEQLLVHADNLVAVIDFWTDKDLYRNAFSVPPGALHVWSLAGDTAGSPRPLRVPLPRGFSSDFGGGTASSHGLFAVFGPFPLVRTGMVVGNALDLRVGPGVVVVNSHAEMMNLSRHVAIRALDGAALWQAEGVVVAVDAEGALCSHVFDALTLRDAGGAARWTVKAGGPHGLGPTRVIGHTPEGLTLFDRATGHRVAAVSKPDTFVLQGDQLVCVYGRRIEAFTLEGSLVWRYENEEAIDSIAPYAERLYALTTRRTVVCLEEDV